MIALHAARAVIGGELVRGAWITLDGDRILAAGDAPAAGATPLECGEVDLLPGCVDLHSDCLENLAHPRPSADLPLSAALHDLDALTCAHGITTSYVCIALEDDATKHRDDERALETSRQLADARSRLRGDYRLHVRVDITRDAVDVLDELAAGGHVGMISYMDHTPGQGQFATVDDFVTYYNTRAGAGPDAARARLEAKLAGGSRADSIRAAVAAVARRHGIVLGSHDDDSPAAVETAIRLGATISEFPVNRAAADAARAGGLHIVMGAPNARRGRSHVANLSARDALRDGVLDALTSDYHPPSMLAAAYRLAAEGVCSLPRAIETVTRGPARAAGLTDRGELRAGQRADIVAVAPRDAHPIVMQTWVGGRPAFGAFEPSDVPAGVGGR